MSFLIQGQEIVFPFHSRRARKRKNLRRRADIWVQKSSFAHWLEIMGINGGCPHFFAPPPALPTHPARISLWMSYVMCDV